MKKIILTGGGTAGHVTPNIALIPELKKRGYALYYIGSKNGIEKKLIEECGIPYYGISSGKLRRYFDLKNFTDPVRILKGYAEARKIIKKIKPDIVFSKGGFVTVPVVVAADKRGVPCVIHESDMTPGLANRICIPHAVKVCANFPETVKEITGDKTEVTGTPIRKELFAGNKIAGLDYCGFTANKPVMLVIGGSLGASSVNTAVRAALPQLLTRYQVIHLCGAGKLEPTLNDTEGYVQYEYVKSELSNMLAAADIVVSRAGANAICELLALKKPNILIPLPASVSRGDQVLNARSFEKQGYSVVLEEEELTTYNLIKAVDNLFEHRMEYVDAMSDNDKGDAVTLIADILDQNIKKD